LEGTAEIVYELPGVATKGDVHSAGQAIRSGEAFVALRDTLSVADYPSVRHNLCVALVAFCSTQSSLSAAWAYLVNSLKAFLLGLGAAKGGQFYSPRYEALLASIKASDAACGQGCVSPSHQPVCAVGQALRTADAGGCIN
jgi:hypothetical protein